MLSLQQQYVALQQQLLAGQLMQQVGAAPVVEDEYVVGDAGVGGYGKETDAVRRLKAQGRYAPY
jgi:uncharacterized protein GlcG (DUF336 family)